MAVEEAAESCGSHAAAAAAAAAAASGGGAAGPATSSPSAAAAAQARKQQRHKLEVYTEVLRRLHESGLPEARAPGFDDELWNHFNRLPARCVSPLLARAPVLPASSHRDVARECNSPPPPVVCAAGGGPG